MKKFYAKALLFVAALMSTLTISANGRIGMTPMQLSQLKVGATFNGDCEILGIYPKSQMSKLPKTAGINDWIPTEGWEKYQSGTGIYTRTDEDHGLVDAGETACEIYSQAAENDTILFWIKDFYLHLSRAAQDAPIDTTYLQLYFKCDPATGKIVVPTQDLNLFIRAYNRTTGEEFDVEIYLSDYAVYSGDDKYYEYYPCYAELDFGAFIMNLFYFCEMGGFGLAEESFLMDGADPIWTAWQPAGYSTYFHSLYAGTDEDGNEIPEEDVTQTDILTYKRVYNPDPNIFELKMEGWGDGFWSKGGVDIIMNVNNGVVTIDGQVTGDSYYDEEEDIDYGDIYIQDVVNFNSETFPREFCGSTYDVAKNTATIWPCYYWYTNRDEGSVTGYFGKYPNGDGGFDDRFSDIFTFTACEFNSTISFDANGGSGEMESVEVAMGSEYVLPECAFTAPEGMEFAKWVIGEDSLEIGATIVADESEIVVKAGWAEAEQPVVYTEEPNVAGNIFDEDSYNFNNGMGVWAMSAWNNNDGNATASIVTPGYEGSKGALQLSNTSEAGQNYAAQFCGSVSVLSQGTYTLTFFAKAGKNGSKIEFGGQIQPWAQENPELMGINFELTNEWKQYTKEFELTFDGLNTFYFNFGKTVDDICIDRIAIVKAPTKEPNVKGNLLDEDSYNFNNGLGKWAMSAWNNNGGNATASVVAPGYDGSKGALKLSNTSEAGQNYEAQFCIALDNAAKKGTYEVKFFAKADKNGSKLEMGGQIQPWAQENPELNVGTFELTNSWKQYSKQFDLNFEGLNAFYFNFGKTVDNLYVDRISIVLIKEDLVEEIKFEESINLENSIIYNMVGQRVTAPVKGNIYIVNGKKMVY